MVVRLHCLKANCLSELVAPEISQDKDSSAGSWENEIFGLVQGLLKMVKSPAPGEFGDATDARARMQGLGTTCHSIGMTFERVIYADPADFSTNFCRHSRRLPRSFSKPSCIPWQRTHLTHFLLCLSLAVPSGKEFGVSEERLLISV